MFHRMKQKIAVLLVALTAVTGIGLAAAPAASAYTDARYATGSCVWLSNMYYCQYWRNYNWWEETFQGKDDGYVYKFTGIFR